MPDAIQCPDCGRPLPAALNSETAQLVQRTAIALRENAARYLFMANANVLTMRVPVAELQELLREVLAKMSSDDFALATALRLEGRNEIVVDEAAWTVALTVAGTYMHAALDAYARAHVAERGKVN